MKVAALDLGTNTFLCLIADVENGIVSKVHEDVSRVVRLGQGVHHSKRFHPEALARAKACLIEFSELIQKSQPDITLAMATSAARDVTNSAELFGLGKEAKIPIEIIPGEREAEITFLGATAQLPKDNKTRLVIDIGGGSTEFIVGRNHKVLYSTSLNIGCVRLTERFILHQPTPESEIHMAGIEIGKNMAPVAHVIKTYKIDEVIAVAGTPGAIAAAELGGFIKEKVEGHVLEAGNLGSWISRFANASVEEKTQTYNIEKGRADVILIGTMILHECLQQLNLGQLVVSTRGVRFGVALEAVRRATASGKGALK